MFNILFIVHYYFVRYIYFHKKNIFCGVQIFIPSIRNQLLVLKKVVLKILCKYRQVWYCFEDLVIKNNHRVRLEAGASSPTVFLSHIPPVLVSSH